MAAIDERVPQRRALLGRTGQSSPGILAQRQIHGRRSALHGLRHTLFDSFANLFGGSSGQPVSERVILAQQAQQQMLGLDVGRTKHAGLIAGEEDGAARHFGVAFKHAVASSQYAPAAGDWYSLRDYG